jgi:protein-L-isoaspartate(D-aspartate) O-methyltransferase
VLDPGQDLPSTRQAGSFVSESTRLQQEHWRRLVEAGAITSEEVSRAFRVVPRHKFVSGFWVRDGSGGLRRIEPSSPERLEKIYSGDPLITSIKGAESTSSASASPLVANMLELLSVRPGMRVLEIGTGTGFNAALLSMLCGPSGEVVTVESQRDVAAQARDRLNEGGYENVRCVEGDGFYGDPEGGSVFDRIIVTVGTTDISPIWIDQLSSTGRLLLPLRVGGANPLMRLRRIDDQLSGIFCGWAGFMQIYGRLHDDSYYGPRVQAPQQPQQTRVDTGGAGEVPLWDGLNEGAAWSADGRAMGFWAVAAFRDQRERVTNWSPLEFGIVESATGSSVVVKRNALAVEGSRDLIGVLRAHYEVWNRMGRPCLSQLRFRFVRSPHVQQRPFYTVSVDTPDSDANR